MKEFDYYIFIDYSENLIGYSIIEKNKLKELIPRISKFAHYKDLRHKKAYIDSIKKVIEKEKITSFLMVYKIREMKNNVYVYTGVLDFLTKHKGCIIFISVDNRQYIGFTKIVKISDEDDVIIKKESELKKGTPEYRTSLVLDTLLNVERLRRKK